jgi:hypothetical protein
MWRPTKEDIGQWLDTKEIEFVVDQNKNHGSVQRNGYRGMCLQICMKFSLLIS